MAHPQNAKLTSISFDKLIINDAENNRLDFTVGLKELQESIEENGLINPITVVKEAAGYRVVAGFRRAHAVQNLKLDDVAVMVRDAEVDQQLVLQITENLERENFNMFEMAEAIRALIDVHGLTRDEVAKRLRRSAGWVSHYVGLYDLPEKVQEMAKAGDLTVTHIRTLHGLRKKVEEKDLIKAAKAVQGMTQAKMAEYGQKLTKRAEATESADTEAAETAAADTQEAEAPQEDSGPSMRTNLEVLTTIRAVNKLMKTAIDATVRAQLQGRIEALQWVIMDDGVVLL
jgi:ParB family chromosome partitioning protein